MKIEFEWPDSVPLDQIDVPFIQGMLDRMAQGFFNYGHMRRYENRSNSLKNIVIRLCKYAGLSEIEKIVRELQSHPVSLTTTLNTEYLIDAANYSMMEFVKPGYTDAYFKATSKKDSPGAIVSGNFAKGKEDYLVPNQEKKVREGD